MIQATYTIEVVDKLYMDHVYEGLKYSGKYRDIALVEKNNLNLSVLPYIDNYLQDINELLIEYDDKPINIKISNNSAYFFLSYNENNFSVIDTNTWSIIWERTIQDAYNTIYEDSALAHVYYVSNDMENAEKYYKKSLEAFSSKEEFFEDMIDDFDTISLYNISEETWINFVKSFRAIPV